MFQRFFKPNSHFVYVRISEDISDSQLATHIRTYNEEAIGKQNILELADCRNVTSTKELTANGCMHSLYQLDLRPRGFHGGKTAFVVQSDNVYGMVRVFLAFSDKMERTTEIFYNIDDALAFLEPDETAEELKEFIEASKQAGAE